jgi:hypothetical protein
LEKHSPDRAVGDHRFNWFGGDLSRDQRQPGESRSERTDQTDPQNTSGPFLKGTRSQETKIRLQDWCGDDSSKKTMPATITVVA